MNTQLVHTLNDSIELLFDGRSLFQYRYDPKFDAVESRKPYLHPIRTLAGNEVTIYRPHDHTWHKGLSMTCANLSGQNFWGGNTYVRDKGYALLPNIGRIQHRGWEELKCDGADIVLRHRVEWITQAEQVWIDEQRTIRVAEINPSQGYWSLDWQSQMKNVSNEALRFGSPTTAGRPMAGYGGLFWRGPRSFNDGKIIGALEQEDMMGQRSPWLAYIGAHDGSGDKSTIIFFDRPGNPNYPNKWFARSDFYPGMAASFMFDQEVPLEVGKEMTLNYRVVFADGAWSHERLEQYAGKMK
jgi:hypothetical protein